MTIHNQTIAYEIREIVNRFVDEVLNGTGEIYDVELEKAIQSILKVKIRLPEMVDEVTNENCYCMKGCEKNACIIETKILNGIE